MNKIIFFVLFSCAPFIAYSQDTFIKKCQRDMLDKYHHGEMKWLMKIYEPRDCLGLSKELIKVTSLNDIIMPLEEVDSIQNNSWTKNFDFLHASEKKKILFRTFRKDFPLISFETLAHLKDFNNISHLTYSTRYEYTKKYTLCDVLKVFKGIRTISIDHELLTPSAEACILKSKVTGVILGKKIKSFNGKYPKSPIIGIEIYSGDLEELSVLKKLTYLGTSEATNSIDALTEIPSLTHLNIISSKSNELEKLGNLDQLIWLSINCHSDETTLDKSPCAQTSLFKNLDFLNRMERLISLDLNYNNLQDQHLENVVIHLPALKSFTARGNKLSVIPDLSASLSLESLDLSGNQIKEHTNLDNLKELYYLNLSGNQITNFKDFSKFRRLKFLNLSGNIQQNLENTYIPETLVALSLNGRCEASSPTNLGDPVEIFLNGVDTQDSNIYREFLQGDFRYIPRKVSAESTKPVETDYEYIDPSVGLESVIVNNAIHLPLRNRDSKNDPLIHSWKFDLDKFKTIKMLSMRCNTLYEIPDVRNFLSLRYLDISANLVSDLNFTNLPYEMDVFIASENEVGRLNETFGRPRIKILNLKGNYIKNVKSIMKSYSKYISFDLSYNLIEDLTPLNDPRMEFATFNFSKNPVKKSKCPENTKNSYINKLCGDLSYDVFTTP